MQGHKYHQASGAILGYSVAPDNMFHIQAGPGEAMLECDPVAPDEFYIDGGVILPRVPAGGTTLSATTILSNGIDTAILSGLPDPCYLLVNNAPVEVLGGSYAVSSDAPGVTHMELIGRYKGGPWVVTAKDLGDWQREIRDQINKERDTRLNGGFIFGGIQFDTDERSRSFVMAAASALGIGIPLPDDFKWTSSDDIDVPMDAETFGAFAGSMMAWGNAVHTHSRALKIALETLTEPDDLRAFDPSAGWPSNVAEDYLTP